MPKPSSLGQRKKRYKGLIRVLIIGVAVFAGFSIYADIGVVKDKLAEFQWWAMAAALGLALLNYALRFLRWTLYLRSSNINLKIQTSASIFLSGFALSITPGKLGELIKCYLIREFVDVPISRSAPLVVGERVTDLTALLILGIIGVSAYGIAQNMIYAGIAVIGLGLFILTNPSLARICISFLTKPRLLKRFRKPLLLFYQGLADLVKPWPLLWATSIAVVAWLAECIGFALVLHGFPGAHLPLGLAVLIYAVTTIAGALSFLPGGLLVTEATMALLLIEAGTGIDKPTAVAATLLTRIATLWFAVFIGLVALSLLRRKSENVDKALDAAESQKTEL